MDSSGNNVYTYVEQMPEFKGNVGEFLGKTLRFPEIAILNNIQGRVIVKFVVSATGDIEDAEISKSVHPSLDSEAIRVVRLMPRWRPGKTLRVNGKRVKPTPVRVYFTLPISFRFDNEGRSSANETFPISHADWGILLAQALRNSPASANLPVSKFKVRLLIDETGTVQGGDVTEDVGSAMTLAVMQAVQKIASNPDTGSWKPATQNGSPAKFIWVQPVSLK